jgi:hypothetical protein
MSLVERNYALQERDKSWKGVLRLGLHVLAFPKCVLCEFAHLIGFDVLLAKTGRSTLSPPGISLLKH